MADYDTSSIKVNPQDLATHADKLRDLAEDVADSINKIADVTFSLELGWAGKTAEEAQHFADKWKGVMVELFGAGHKNDPISSNSGVLNVMAVGLEQVAIGFDKVEGHIADSFHKLSVSLTSPSDTTTPSSTPASVNDPDYTSIGENFG